MRFTSVGLAACLAAGIHGACLANDLPATEQFSETTVEFKIDGQFGVLMLTVAGPNGYYASATARTASPIIELKSFGAFDDGEYGYQLTASTDDKITLRTPLNDGRDDKPTTTIFKGLSKSGSFNVSRGMIVKHDTSAPSRRDPSK
jgi:hypothetical protein